MTVITSQNGVLTPQIIKPVSKEPGGPPSMREAFRQMMQKAYEASTDSASQSGGTGEAKTAVRTKLSNQDIAELAGKYDPHHMSQNQYDAFLDTLVEKGVLSREDTRRLGYNGFNFLDIDLEAFAGNAGNKVGGGGTCYVTREENFGDDLKRSLEDAENDPLRWVQILLARNYVGTDILTREGILQRTEALNVLSSILSRMESYRA